MAKATIIKVETPAELYCHIQGHEPQPCYIEVDLEALFTQELLADFSAFWLLAHASRFGAAETPPNDCPWERWRAAGQQAGVTVRGKLRDQVAKALRAPKRSHTALSAAISSSLSWTK